MKPNAKSESTPRARSSTWKHLNGIEELDTHSIPNEVLVHLADDGTRPMFLAIGSGVVVNLRAINFSEDHTYDDMISLRCWLRPDGILTVSKQPVRAVEELLASPLPEGETPGGTWHRLVTHLIENIALALQELQEKAGEIEEAVIDPEQSAPGITLNQVRRSLIQIGRFLLPQRDVFMMANRGRYPGEAERPLFPPEIVQDAARYVEDVVATRDHCLLIQEEINSQQTGQMNRRMLVLSIVGCIFLPLTFLAGLLGMNVEGIPGATSPIAFWGVCCSMVLIAFFLFAWMAWKDMW